MDSWVSDISIVSEWGQWAGGTMYSVVGHQNFAREGRRRGQAQGPQTQESQENAAKEAKETARRRHRHRISLATRLLNFVKRRFNPEPGESLHLRVPHFTTWLFHNDPCALKHLCWVS